MTPEEEISIAFQLDDMAKVQTPIEALATSPKKNMELLDEQNELLRYALKLKDRGQNIRLKLMLARFAIVAVSAQLVASNAVMTHYLLWNEGGASEPVMIAWMSSTVVEVIGIVYVIARNLFPDKSKREGSEGDGSKRGRK